MKTHKKHSSLSLKIPVLFIISYVIMAVFIILVVYNRFETRMINDYTRMAEGVTNLMTNALDTDKIDEYIEKNYSMKEYNDILKYYYSLKDNYPDIYYMYVYRFEHADPPEATVIIDLDEEYTDDPPQDSIDWIGDTYVADEPFASEIDIMLTGSQSLVHTVHTADDEYLLSYVRPVTDRDGKYVASACVDFSMADMHQQDLYFVMSLMGILGILMVLILIVNILAMNKIITSPLNRLSDCIDSFEYETGDDRSKNVERLENLNLKRNDEIGNLYQNFLANMKESIFYMSNYNRAVGVIENKEKEIAKISKMTYKDSLTKVSNKNAYLNDETALNEEIKAGLTEIGAVVIDINNLKYINDTFGHDKGDIYIKGCCRIICDTFKHSVVYRTGGDEFLVVLKDRDFEARQDLYQNILSRYSESYAKENAEPWNRYSASVGLAVYETGDDLGRITKRADKEMYRNKEKFRKKNKAYR